MDFELPEELAQLQETVRRLAQDKVKPRARDIDETGEYPQDLFELFRDAVVVAEPNVNPRFDPRFDGARRVKYRK